MGRRFLFELLQDRTFLLFLHGFSGLPGKQIGQKPGIKLTTKKSVAAKDIIQKHNKSFGGSLNDVETIRQAGISRKTFYKYKRELLEEVL